MKKAGSNIKTAGQSVIEILVALTIFSLVAAAIFTLFFGGQSLVVDSRTAEQAIGYANEGAEAVKSIRDRNWNELTDGDHGLVFLSGEWYFASGTSDTRGIFTRKVTISAVDQWIKKASTTVSWQTNPVRPQTIEILEELVNWEAVRDLGGDGGGRSPTGNWQNPRTFGSIDLGPGNEATDLDVINKIVYMSAEASAQDKPDFFIVNATDAQNPFIVSSLNTGPALNAIDVAGNYAYAANRKADEQLHIIDVSNIQSPVLVKRYRIPGVTGASAIGNTLFYAAGKLYIGLNKAEGPEFHVLDVSDPINPSVLGSYEVNDNINDIHISGGRAYLATGLDNAGLIVLDVSNPAAITLLGQTFSSDTESVFNLNSQITFIGPGQDFYVINTSNPANMTSLGFIGAGNVINDMIARDNLVFLATSDSNREFQVINISDTANPTLLSHFNFPQVATGIDYEDNLVYVSVRSNDALRIITSQ